MGHSPLLRDHSLLALESSLDVLLIVLPVSTEAYEWIPLLPIVP